MTINWGAFIAVALTSFVAAVVVVIFYALALRLLSIGSPDDTETDSAITSSKAAHRPAVATVGGYLCLAISAASVLYGLYLIIPQFH